MTCFYGCFTFAQCFAVHILLFCPTHHLLRPKDEDSTTGTKFDLWLGCHDYLLPIDSFANHLICFMTPSSQAHYFGNESKLNYASVQAGTGKKQENKIIVRYQTKAE